MVEENEQAESYGKLFRELREQKHISLREAAFGILSKTKAQCIGCTCQLTVRKLSIDGQFLSPSFQNK